MAQRILELRDEGVELNDIAVLYRAHYHAIELQLELSRRGIPYQITSGIRFFEQAHIKDVTAFVRFVANPRDEVAFKRMVKLLPGIGNRSAENLWRAWENSPPVAGGGDRWPGKHVTTVRVSDPAQTPATTLANAPGDERSREIKEIVGATRAHAGRNRARRATESAIGNDHVGRRSDLR